jgi:hypothetical protein
MHQATSNVDLSDMTRLNGLQSHDGVRHEWKSRKNDFCAVIKAISHLFFASLLEIVKAIHIISLEFLPSVPLSFSVRKIAKSPQKVPEDHCAHAWPVSGCTAQARSRADRQKFSSNE